MQRVITTIGELECQVLDAGAKGARPDLLLILCHGFGAPGDDLVALGAELFERRPELAGRVRAIFPAAPMDLSPHGVPGGRAWWLVDVERLLGTQDLRQLQNDIPEGLARARRLLLGLVERATRDAGLPLGRLVLGGFSQGAMLATEVALRLDEAPAALCLFSGTLIHQAEWRRLAPRRSGLEVLQSHGRQDPLLPFANAEALRDLLSEAGAKVDFVPFSGGHAIPYEVVDRLAALVASKLPK
jgi:phospholipase/carboxylesterase